MERLVDFNGKSCVAIDGTPAARSRHVQFVPRHCESSGMLLGRPRRPPPAPPRPVQLLHVGVAMPCRAGPGRPFKGWPTDSLRSHARKSPGVHLLRRQRWARPDRWIGSAVLLVATVARSGVFSCHAAPLHTWRGRRRALPPGRHGHESSSRAAQPPSEYPPSPPYRSTLARPASFAPPPAGWSHGLATLRIGSRGTGYTCSLPIRRDRPYRSSAGLNIYPLYPADMSRGLMPHPAGGRLLR